MKKILYLIIFLILIGTRNSVLSQVQNITIKYERSPDNSVDILYEKKLPGSYYVKLELLNLENCYSSGFEGVVCNSSGSLVKLKPINNQQCITFSCKSFSIMGVPNPRVDSLFIYTLPFRERKKVRVIEASNLEEEYFGSERPANWKSYIVFTQTPDTVCSMRKGIVVKVTDEYDADTTIVKSFTSKRNSVVIEHADGTYASYAGFKKDAIFVELGQTVYPYTQLGIMELFNKGSYKLSFCVYYLSDYNFEYKENQTLKDKKSQLEYLTPYFITQNGIRKVEPGKEYTTTYNEAVSLQELTRGEKKKYTKNPKIFE